MSHQSNIATALLLQQPGVACPADMYIMYAGKAESKWVSDPSAMPQATPSRDEPQRVQSLQDASSRLRLGPRQVDSLGVFCCPFFRG